MDATDPILLVASAATVSVLLAPLASRLIARAAALVAADAGEGADTDLSRIRDRHR
jgi:hypothetical protein